MVSSTVNVRLPASPALRRCSHYISRQVVRYTALFSGIAYGWYHRRTLQTAHDQHKLEHAVHHREQLVAEAKDAWKRKQQSSIKDTTREFRYFYLHPSNISWVYLGPVLLLFLATNYRLIPQC